MKYGAALVGFYEFGDEELRELESLLKFWRAQVDLMECMQKSVKHFSMGKKAVELIDVKDKSMSDPDEEAIEKLFNGYGEEAAEQLIQKLTDWQTKVKWQ